MTTKKYSPIKGQNKINVFGKAVNKYTLQGKLIDTYESLAKAAKANGVSRSSLRLSVQKKSKQLHGFVYRFKGDKYKGENSDFSWTKSVVQFSIEGKKLNTYESIVEAGVKTGIEADNISKCAHKKTKVTAGFVWRFAGDHYRGEYVTGIKNRAKALVQYTLGGKKIAEFSSINEAEMMTGYSSATLRDCIHKRAKVSHGFVWRVKGEAYKGEYKNYTFGKPVTQFTLEGKKISSYPSIEEAARSTGLTPDNIQKNVNGHNKTAGGFIWKYADEKEKRKVAQVRTEYSTDNIEGISVVQYSLDGKKIEVFPSITKAAKANKLRPSNIRKVLDTPNLTCAGFVWRTKGNRYYGELSKVSAANKVRIVTQYDLNGKRINTFNSLKDAQRHTGISGSTISMVAKGTFGQSGGFVWRFGEGRKKLDKESLRVNRIKRKAVLQYSLEGKKLKEFESLQQAGRALNINPSRISHALRQPVDRIVAGFYWKLK